MFRNCFRESGGMTVLATYEFNDFLPLKKDFHYLDAPASILQSRWEFQSINIYIVSPSCLRHYTAPVPLRQTKGSLSLPLNPPFVLQSIRLLDYGHELTLPNSLSAFYLLSPSRAFFSLRPAPLRPASHPSLNTKPPNSIMSSPPYPPPPYQRYASPPSYSRSDDERRRRETSRTAALLRWFQLKRYQYEVTFSLYMLTPTEKFIFSEWKQISPSFSVTC